MRLDDIWAVLEFTAGEAITFGDYLGLRSDKKRVYVVKGQRTNMIALTSAPEGNKVSVHMKLNNNK